MECALIGEFEETVAGLLACLTPDNIGDATGIVRLFLDIRGYGPVKEEAAKKVRAQIQERMDEFAAVTEKAA